jgi:hypothetical protein
MLQCSALARCGGRGERIPTETVFGQVEGFETPSKGGRRSGKGLAPGQHRKGPRIGGDGLQGLRADAGDADESGRGGRSGCRKRQRGQGVPPQGGGPQRRRGTGLRSARDGSGRRQAMQGPRPSTWRLFPFEPSKNENGTRPSLGSRFRVSRCIRVLAPRPEYTPACGSGNQILRRMRCVPPFLWQIGHRTGSRGAVDADQRAGAAGAAVIVNETANAARSGGFVMRLFFLIYTLAATALAGVGITTVLVAGLPGWEPIVIAPVVGAVAALPTTWVATKKIAQL